MTDALTSLVQGPVGVSASGSSQKSQPNILNLGSYNLTYNPAQQVASGLFSPASSGGLIGSLYNVVAAASAGSSDTFNNSKSFANAAYGAALQLIQRETPAEAYLRELLSGTSFASSPVVANSALSSATIKTNSGVSVAQGGTAVLDSTSLSASVTGTPAGDVTYRVTNGPQSGYLALANAPNAPIASFTQQDLDSGLVRYVNNGSDASADNFTFSVGSGKNTGTQATFSIGVTPTTFAVIAPKITANTGVTVAEGGATVITTANLNTTDIRNDKLTYRITSAPKNGHLELAGNPGTAITSFTQSDLAAGNVVYVHNGSETTSDSFHFTVSDGVGYSGANFNINVTPVDDPPVLATDAGTTVNEGGTTTLTTSQLNATDVDTSNANLTYTVTSAPANGILQLASNPGTAISSFTQADLVAGNVQYVHNGSETTFDSFNFSLSDQTTALAPASFNINVNPVDDPPVLTTDTGTTVAEGGTTTLTTSQLNATDVDTSNANLNYTVTSAPANGILQLGSNPGTAITSFTQADLAAGNVQYVHNGSETTSDAFTFALSDQTTTLAPQNFNINVTPVDDPPTVAVNTGATVNEGAAVTLTTANLKASDVDTSNANLTFTVTAAPANGILQLSTHPGTAITSFTEADLAAGRVQYVHNGSETTSDVFTFRLSDQTTTLAPQNFSITVNPVDDPPMVAVNKGATVSVLSGSAILTTAELNATDVDTSAANLTFSVTAGLKHGYLSLTSSPTTHITSFTEAQLQAGLVEYTHTGGLSRTADSFTFALKDQTTTLAPQTFRINFTL